MTAIIQLYNHTTLKFADGSFLAGDTYKLMLCSEAIFDATHSTLAAISKTEIAGNGYTAGGITLTGVSIATAAASGARFTANDASVTATGGSIAATHAILYNATDAGEPPVALLSFGGNVVAENTDPFVVRWDLGGIVRFTYVQ